MIAVDTIMSNKESQKLCDSMLRIYIILYIYIVFTAIITYRFVDSETERRYKAKIVLQVRIKPGSYTEGPSTVASHLRRGSEPIDPNFSNDKVEWMTNRECVHFIYGVLIKLEEW